MRLMLSNNVTVDTNITETGIVMRVNEDGSSGTVLLNPNAAKSLGELLCAASIVAKSDRKAFLYHRDHPTHDSEKG